MNTIKYYHYNHQGSVALVTGLTGSIQQVLQYLPYGGIFVDHRTGSYSSTYTFSAKEKDSESGYNYFGARYYTDNIMMWLSVDPMSDMRPGVSPYSYCQWNPIGRKDDWGMLDDHYFDEDGDYLGDDGEGNAIRIILRSSFDVQTNNGRLYVSRLRVQEFKVQGVYCFGLAGSKANRLVPPNVKVVNNINVLNAMGGC